MKLTKPQQIRNFKKLFGSKADLFDFKAHVDGRLSYEENKRIILAKAKRRGLNAKSKLTFRGDPVFYLDKAKQFQKTRSPRSKGIDAARNAKDTYNYKFLTAEQFFKWKRNPQRYDIASIDSKGSRFKTKPSRYKKLTISQIDALDIL